MNYEQFETGIKYKIEYIEVGNPFILYRIMRINLNNRTYTLRHGNCLQEETEKLVTDPERFQSKIYYYRLWKKGTKEKARTDYDEFLRTVYDYIVNIEEVFEDIKRNSIFNYEILHFNKNKHGLWTSGRHKPLPHSIYFNKIDGAITCKKYNIVECVKVLNERNDIKWVLKDGTKQTECPYDIEKIPKNLKSLDFIWMPSEEIWDDIYYKFFYNQKKEITYDLIASEILHLVENQKNKN